MKKKILIISYMFYPENNPRSFRTFELAKELAKKYEVTILTKNHFFNYEELEKKYNFRIIEIPSGFLFNRQNKSQIETKKRKENKEIIKKLYNYLFYSREVEFSYEIYRVKNNIQDYDIVISISNPFACHIGTWLSFKRKRKSKIILDYGDPFYYNPAFTNIAFYFKYVEKKILRFADQVVVPIEEAKKVFKNYGEKIIKKLTVIPQGINIDDYTINQYHPNEKITFMYAGAFYEKIRNPLKFFEEIEKIEEDYSFKIYTDIDGLKRTEFGKILLEKIKNNKRIVLKNKISRKECIRVMSTMDFLINLENLGGVQTPSKLIDYGISKRPVYSFNQVNFKIEVLKEFFSKNYKNSLNISVEKYDIKNVSMQFEKLFNEE